MNYYDRDGQPLDMWRWADLFERRLDPGRKDYSRVEATQLGDVWVSTVWLGADHNFDDVGPPLIFETMIFPECDYCVRTPTETAARAAHAAAVEHVASGAYAAEARADAEGAR